MERDVYCEFATDIYKRVITAADKLERFVGKTGILSLGYSSSAMVFQNMLRVQGNVNMAIVDASAVVEIYRDKYSAIVRNWRRVSNEVLTRLTGSYEGAVPDEGADLWAVQGPAEHHLAAERQPAEL